MGQGLSGQCVVLNKESGYMQRSDAWDEFRRMRKSSLGEGHSKENMYKGTEEEEKRQCLEKDK